jgi:SpoVK/Ycf46/Vps4 family AAA+-type ATPase
MLYACRRELSQEKAAQLDLDDEKKGIRRTIELERAWEAQIAARKAKDAKVAEGESYDPKWYDVYIGLRGPRPGKSIDLDKPLKGFDHSFVPGDAKLISSAEWHSDPMSWCFLEAESSIRSALSLANTDRQSSSFTADRIDLSLQCPDPNSHDQMDEFVKDLAGVLHADLIRLDANDFAELSEDYVGQGDDGPGSFSSLGFDVFDGYAATSTRIATLGPRRDVEEENDMEEDEEDERDDHDDTGVAANALAASLKGILLTPRDFMLHEPLAHLKRLRSRVSSVESRSVDMNRDDARLDALLDGLLDATTGKRSLSNEIVMKGSDNVGIPTFEEPIHTTSRFFQMHPLLWRSQTGWLLASCLHQMETTKHNCQTSHKIVLESEPYVNSSDEGYDVGQKIVHIRDLRDICRSSIGENIVRRLVKIVRKRRKAGERILVLGTTAQDIPGPISLPGERSDDFPFRTLSIPPLFGLKSRRDRQDFISNSPELSNKTLDEPAYRRILEINFRHIQAMLRRLNPGAEIDITSPKARLQMNLPGTHFLTEKVLSLDEVQRLSLVALGLTQSYAEADALCPLHIALAAFITARNDHIMQCWSAFKERKDGAKIKAQALPSEKETPSANEARGIHLGNLRRSCNSHETRLLSGVIDPQNLKTRFADVHVPSETIDALKSLTSLSLLRPDAFKYGVLANDRLPGLLLYGPPGTGKTLLAKAVAKESKATVLEVTGAQIYEKYVGEGEKMVRAVFSLAKKLSPCVVFIDEADAIFGSRSNHSNRNTHREIINQFLREWDGMDDHGVFIMVASNRPFDLDDAVLRRLPRRLLIDLPVSADRESILRIHLKDENLDSSVSLRKLAEQTPLYSGSDLKNLSVAAALACIREENELADLRKDDAEFKLPEKRTLTSKHFDKALSEISASISENMSSLTAIRKFDEQYGDRKGRRKKTDYGFGTSDGAVDESAAMVRQPSSPPP